MAPNALVAEYYGELYTPWRWFEKQDLIKKYCKEKKVAPHFKRPSSNIPHIDDQQSARFL